MTPAPGLPAVLNDPPVGISDSGYQRVLLSPGIEFDIHPVMIYADVEFDVVQFSREISWWPRSCSKPL